MMATLSFNELINSTCIMKDIKSNSLYFSYKFLKRRFTAEAAVCYWNVCYSRKHTIWLMRLKILRDKLKHRKTNLEQSKRFRAIKNHLIGWNDLHTQRIVVVYEFVTHGIPNFNEMLLY